MRRTMRQSIRREHVVMGVKAALGASVSIGLAMLLHLQYAATAGVICILSLMGTKMETLRIARGRLLALATGTLMAAACYHALGFSLLGFTVYLFIFAVMCYACRWGYAVTLVSVLMSHFMAYGEMTVPLLANEGLLFLIGTGVGILVNLHLRPDEEKMRRHMQTVDEMMRAAMHAISRGAEGLAYARQVLDALHTPPCPGKPRYILLNTLKGKGVSFMEGQVGWHGKAPNAEQAAQALKELED